VTVNIWIGFDQREAAAFHVCAQSLIETASVPIAIKPLALRSLNWFSPHKGGTNQFITSRYLIPCLEDFSGWALFIDSDVLVRSDIARLWALRDPRYAVQVVKHDYRTSARRKYVGSPIENDNLDYPAKNWTSVMLLNCGHPAVRKLTPGYVTRATSQHLHRFDWLDQNLIGELPRDWNHLVSEMPRTDHAALAHYTLGVPGFDHYVDCEHSREWHQTLLRANEIVGESPVEMMQRAAVRA
jgi:lipopolysaccharide biosynthesis glycosyltransferase